MFVKLVLEIVNTKTKKKEKTMIELLKKEINDLIDEKNDAQSRLDYWFDRKNLTMQVEWRAIRNTLNETINRLLRVKYEYLQQEGGV